MLIFVTIMMGNYFDRIISVIRCNAEVHSVILICIIVTVIPIMIMIK